MSLVCVSGHFGLQWVAMEANNPCQCPADLLSPPPPLLRGKLEVSFNLLGWNCPGIDG